MINFVYIVLLCPTIIFCALPQTIKPNAAAATPKITITLNTPASPVIIPAIPMAASANTSTHSLPPSPIALAASVQRRQSTPNVFSDTKIGNEKYTSTTATAPVDIKPRVLRSQSITPRQGGASAAASPRTPYSVTHMSPPVQQFSPLRAKPVSPLNLNSLPVQSPRTSSRATYTRLLEQLKSSPTISGLVSVEQVVAAIIARQQETGFLNEKDYANVKILKSLVPQLNQAAQCLNSLKSSQKAKSESE